MNTYPAGEKLVHLLSYALQSYEITTSDIMNYFECCRTTARRLGDRLYYMQYELGFYSCDKISPKGRQNNIFHVKINKNFTKQT